MPKKLKRIFEETYTGKKVPKKYQKKYGKTYDENDIESLSYAIANSKGLKIDRI